jgi:hypothetical protein
MQDRNRATIGTVVNKMESLPFSCKTTQELRTCVGACVLFYTPHPLCQVTMAAILRKTTQWLPSKNSHSPLLRKSKPSGTVDLKLLFTVWLLHDASWRAYSGSPGQARLVSRRPYATIFDVSSDLTQFLAKPQRAAPNIPVLVHCKFQMHFK